MIIYETYIIIDYIFIIVFTFLFILFHNNSNLLYFTIRPYIK